MPQRYALKSLESNSYYHVFFRGANKSKIFTDNYDKNIMESLFARYLGTKSIRRPNGYNYPNYRGNIELVSYCFMQNHVHLLLYVNEVAEDMTKFMASLLTSYSKIYNSLHNRVGGLFESRYKAKKIESQEYLLHITRYIHMNPTRWFKYRFSSLKYYIDSAEIRPTWLSVLSFDEFNDQKEYIDFLTSYQSSKDDQEKIKHCLADQ
jgi:putative transposase